MRFSKLQFLLYIFIGTKIFFFFFYLYTNIFKLLISLMLCCYNTLLHFVKLLNTLIAGKAFWSLQTFLNIIEIFIWHLLELSDCVKLIKNSFFKNIITVLTLNLC